MQHNHHLEREGGRERERERERAIRGLDDSAAAAAADWTYYGGVLDDLLGEDSVFFHQFSHVVEARS